MTAPTLLHDLLDRAGPDPDRPAVTGAGRTLTRAELAATSRLCAAVLRRRGVRRHDRVVLTQSTDPLLAALVFGASRAGAVFSVVHDQIRRDILEHVLTDSAPALVVSDVDAVADAAAEQGVPVLTPAELAGELEALRGADTPPDPDGTAVPPLPVDPACMIYTSGTTAMPKAIVSTHAQMVFSTRAIGSRLGYTADDVVYCPLPMSFDYGLYQVFLAADAGAHVHLATPSEIGPRLLGNLNAAGATVLPGIPQVSAALLRLVRRRPDEVPPLRLLTNTGSHVPADVLDGLRDVIPTLRVQLMFGLTECKRISIMDPDEDRERPGALGTALPDTEIFTVDDDGTPLPAGEVGEIAVRGPNVMAGYWQRPELTAERFVSRDGIFPELRTGDYGWVDADGYLYFDGRRDDVYKQQGFRVSAVEVEAAAAAIDGVAEAAVLLPDGEREATLVVVASPDTDEVRGLLRERLEDFKVPPHVVAVESLPRNANGKFDKKALAGLVAEPADA